ncbi:hypothetical protein BH18CHL2_BH18CHL2_00490 [soil metagenome]
MPAGMSFEEAATVPHSAILALQGLRLRKGRSSSEATGCWSSAHRATWDRVATLKELIADGKVKPVIDRRFPLSEVVAALRHVDEGPARGKVVISV